MRRYIALLALCLMLPVQSLAVIEGVVEDAPAVMIELPETSDGIVWLCEEEHRETAERLRQEAAETAHLWFGSDKDAQLILVESPVWYLEAEIGEDGSAEYHGETREGLRLTFETSGKQVMRRIKALYDLETKALMRLENEYIMKNMLGDADDWRIMEDDTALHMALMYAQELPGGEGIQMTLTQDGGERHAVAHGLLKNGWGVRLTFDRAEHAVTLCELVRGSAADY